MQIELPDWATVVPCWRADGSLELLRRSNSALIARFAPSGAVEIPSLTSGGAAIAVDRVAGFFTTDEQGNIISALPTSDPEVLDALYVDAGVVKVSAGPGE